MCPNGHVQCLEVDSGRGYADGPRVRGARGLETVARFCLVAAQLRRGTGYHQLLLQREDVPENRRKCNRATIYRCTGGTAGARWAVRSRKGEAQLQPRRV